MKSNETNILHIASFNGNIGDNANHNGLRKIVKSQLVGDVNFDEMEMREFYKSWSISDFNSEDFINKCNSYDFIIIGGGNFFELKWNYSSTGTTINLKRETIEKIKKPILFFGLGCDIEKGVTQSSIKKFDQFLSTICSSNQFLVTIRNDGSLGTIKKLYGNKYINKITRVPDGAFNFNLTSKNYLSLAINRKRIGINVARDMEEIRFGEHYKYNDFINEFSMFVNEFLQKNQNYDVIFFPHIYSDLGVVFDVINNINDRDRRYRITVAPYLTGWGAEQYIFEIYNTCQIILGMRFHTNVYAISQEIPSIGLGSYKKVNYLYEELNLLDRVVNVNEVGFKNELHKKIELTIKEISEVKHLYKNVNDNLSEQINSFKRTFNEWLIKNNIK